MCFAPVALVMNSVQHICLATVRFRVCHYTPFLGLPNILLSYCCCCCLFVLLLRFVEPILQWKLPNYQTFFWLFLKSNILLSIFYHKNIVQLKNIDQNSIEFGMSGSILGLHTQQCFHVEKF